MRRFQSKIAAVPVLRHDFNPDQQEVNRGGAVGEQVLSFRAVSGINLGLRANFLLLTGLEKDGRVVIEFSNDSQAPYRLFYHTGRGNVARERYVHVAGAII